MGKDNGNTTNSWLNMAKIFEVTVNDGVSSLTGKKVALNHKELGYENREQMLLNVKEAFIKQCQHFIPVMVEAANAASEALSVLQVPFLSTMMGGIESGIDTRDIKQKGTKYNGSGCLIHGLSVVADSIIAVEGFMKDGKYDPQRLYRALMTDYEGEDELRRYMLGFPKYGNNIANVDNTAVEIVTAISALVENSRNYLGSSFRPDYSTPSTHLLYGYKVGATPDGRHAREMLGYGIDPLYGEASNGLGFRMLSNFKLPFAKMPGGYASHYGIDPKYFKGASFEEKGLEFRNKVINTLFFNPENKKEIAPFYLYVNVTTPEILRKLLANPKKYAPGGVYIVRIHGTFVNFLDLSPDIQNDIIKRLDLESTAI
jgi:formate C-acetyltransferase